MYTYYKVHEFKIMFVLLWWLVFSWQLYTFISWKKIMFLIFWSNTYQSFSIMCYFVFSSSFASALWFIETYIYILYIHQRIDLRFCCGSVRLFLVHIVCFTDIFTSLHLNHHTCTSPKPTRSFYTNTLTKFNCFHSVRGCLYSP